MTSYRKEKHVVQYIKVLVSLRTGLGFWKDQKTNPTIEFRGAEIHKSLVAVRLFPQYRITLYNYMRSLNLSGWRHQEYQELPVACCRPCFFVRTAFRSSSLAQNLPAIAQLL